MDQMTFIRRMQEEHDACVEISRAKNADYAELEDAFANFRGTPPGITPAQGILVRMNDKFKRVSNLLSRPAAVKDESVADTLRDIANYSLILLLLLESEAADDRREVENWAD